MAINSYTAELSILCPEFSLRPFTVFKFLYRIQELRKIQYTNHKSHFSTLRNNIGEAGLTWNMKCICIIAEVTRHTSYLRDFLNFPLTVADLQCPSPSSHTPAPPSISSSLSQKSQRCRISLWEKKPVLKSNSINWAKQMRNHFTTVSLRSVSFKSLQTSWKYSFIVYLLLFLPMPKIYNPSPQQRQIWESHSSFSLLNGRKTKRNGVNVT